MDDQLALVIRLAVAVVALVPFIVFLLSYRRTRMIRMLFAALGFGVFFVKEVLLAAGIFTIVLQQRNPHAPVTVIQSGLQLLEAAIDLAIIVLFALAILWKQGASSDGQTGAGDKKESV